MVVIPIIMLSGGMGAVESQPDIVQRLTMALPSRHFLAFAKSVVFRGAGPGAVWVAGHLATGKPQYRGVVGGVAHPPGLCAQFRGRVGPTVASRLIAPACSARDARCRHG